MDRKQNLESIIYTGPSLYQILHILGGTCLGYPSVARPNAQRRDPNADSKASTPCRSITRINLPRTPSASDPLMNTTKVAMNLQIQLHPITNPVILERKLILKRPLALPLQHNLMRLSPNDRRDLCFE